MTIALPIATSSTSAFVEGRRSPRRLISVQATISSSGSGVGFCEVRDISQHGCRLKLELEIAVGSDANVVSGDAINLTGTVMWAFAGEAGLRFINELPNETVEQILSLK